MCKTRGPYKLNLIGQNQAWRWRRVWRMCEHILDAGRRAAPTSDLAPDAGDARPVCRSVVLAGGRGNVGAMASRGRGARRQGHDRLPLVTAFLTALTVVHLYVVVRTPFDFHRVSCPGV